jgi:hypothetical protein
MPAKKTFHSIRVRGFAHFDKIPEHLGVQLPTYKSLVFVLDDSDVGNPVFTVLFNSFGVEPVFSRLTAGIYNVSMAGQFPEGKVLPSSGWGPGSTSIAFGGFRDDDDNFHVMTFTPGGDQDDLDAVLVVEVRVFV